ncbi:cardiotrophin-like cytokine factor 1 isoform X1 [Motacilla alba alba]|uniref:cardiotrophin-like cytokine factor 1 isoform X1 n=1 Tax=Motacilla alba alba TaxID=1094192 RepID=UPI0018D4EF5E|nr:cardiotrophin-like cytokine factor 1 isoform X1 [Motacilla alba alba]
MGVRGSAGVSGVGVPAEQGVPAPVAPRHPGSSGVPRALRVTPGRHAMSCLRGLGASWPCSRAGFETLGLFLSDVTGIQLCRLEPPSSTVCAGDSWGIFTFLCAALCNLPALPALNCSEELGAGQSIQQTYDLTRYLEHQLRTLAGTYLNYLGPPFNEPDFNPPRLARAERVPSATVDLDLWRGLTDNARLAANYRAYSRLLCYLRVLDGQVGTAELRHRLAHFCASLQGLVLSIGGVMSSLGYPLPAGPAGPPAPPGAPAAPNDFLKKMDDFWLLKELQTWLWRSAKDFNRLKKKVPPAVVTLRLEARGF